MDNLEVLKMLFMQEFNMEMVARDLIEKFEDYCTENEIDDIVDCWIKED